MFLKYEFSFNKLQLLWTFFQHLVITLEFVTFNNLKKFNTQKNDTQTNFKFPTSDKIFSYFSFNIDYQTLTAGWTMYAHPKVIICTKGIWSTHFYSLLFQSFPFARERWPKIHCSKPNEVYIYADKF